MQYEQLIKIVQTVIDSFTNIAVAHFNGLKKFLQTNTLKVQVQNPQKKVEVSGDVKVSNMPPLLKALGGLVLAINSLKKPIISDKSVKVLNLKDIEFPEMPKMPEHPKEMKISNMNDFVRGIEKIAEFLAKVKYDPRIEVNPTPVNVKAPVVNVEAPIVNVPKQDPPVVNVEKPDLSEFKKIMAFLTELSAKKPLPVRLSDGKAFYKALEKMADIYAGGSGGSSFQTGDGSDGRAMLNNRSELKVTISDTWDANDVDRISSTLTRFGEETADGVWRVREVTKSGTITTIRHATSRNNPDITGYEDAWTDRENLTYGYAREAL